MTDSLVSLVRQLGPRDHLRFPELAKISACVEAFAAGDPPSMDAYLSALGDEIDDVKLVCKHGRLRSGNTQAHRGEFQSNARKRRGALYPAAGRARFDREQLAACGLSG